MLPSDSPKKCLDSHELITYFLAGLTVFSPVTGLSYIAVLLKDLIVFFTGYKFIVPPWFIPMNLLLKAISKNFAPLIIC